jgi:hypothetical protein
MADDRNVPQNGWPMYPPVAGACQLEGPRLTAFNQMIAALRTLDVIGEADAAIALCGSIEILVGGRLTAEDREDAFVALLDQHDTYFADLIFQRFLSDRGEGQVEFRP